MTFQIKPLFYIALMTLLGILLAQACPIRASAADPAPNTLTPEVQQAGWKLLFDGKTTNGL